MHGAPQRGIDEVVTSRPGTSRRLLLLAVGLGALAALLYHADPLAVGRVLSRCDARWLALAGACIATATLLGAYNAFLLVNRRDELAWRQFLPVYWIAWATGMLVPGQVGDIAATAALLHRHAMDWRHVIGRSVLDKVISLLIIGALGATGLLVVLYGWPAPASLAGALSAAAAGLAVLIVLARTGIARGRDDGAGGVRGQFMSVLRELHDTLAGHPLRIGVNFALSIVKAVLIGTAYWAALLAMGAETLVWARTVMLASTSSLVAYVPVSLNGMGVVEAAGVTLFGHLGVAAAIVLSAYLALRALSMSIAGVPALVLWLRLR
jgi:uncharacterized membrane protein YbhN (UPF0104 family)